MHHRVSNKKLEAAARHWVSGGRCDSDDADDLATDMAAFGIADDTQADVLAQAERADADCVVYPVNGPVLELFLACSTQWRVRPMGGIIGLDYAAIEIAIKRRGLDCDELTFYGLQIMERTVIEEINKRVDQ